MKVDVESPTLAGVAIAAGKQLGLDGWRVRVRFEDLPEGELGRCLPVIHEHMAEIVLHRGPDRYDQFATDVEETLRHELVHVTQAAFLQLLAVVRSHLVLPAHQALFEAQVRDAAEYQAGLLLRGLDA